MVGKRIVFTGETGKAGRRAVPHLKAKGLQKDGLGFQVFNAANDTATLNEPTADFLKRVYLHTPITRTLGESEAPLSNRKASEVLGFREAHDWRGERA